MATPLPPPGGQMPVINFASLFGFQSSIAAFLFTAFYTPLTLYFVWETYRKFCYIHLFIAAFCGARVIAFGLRAVLIVLDSAGQNQHLLLIDLVFFGAGFSSLLYALFSLQYDRDYISQIHPKSKLIKLLSNKHIYHTMLLFAIAISMGGTIVAFYVRKPEVVEIGNGFRQAGTGIIFILSVIYGIKVLFHYELSSSSLTTNHQITNHTSTPTSHLNHIRNITNLSSKTQKLLKKPGNIHTRNILFILSTLILIRTTYSIAILNTKSSNGIMTQNEKTFYPLSALPEFICCCLLTIPGLIFSRKEFKELVVDGMNIQNEPRFRRLGRRRRGSRSSNSSTDGLITGLEDSTNSNMTEKAPGLDLDLEYGYGVGYGINRGLISQGGIDGNSGHENRTRTRTHFKLPLPITLTPVLGGKSNTKKKPKMKMKTSYQGLIVEPLELPPRK